MHKRLRISYCLYFVKTFKRDTRYIDLGKYRPYFDFTKHENKVPRENNERDYPIQLDVQIVWYKIVDYDVHKYQH